MEKALIINNYPYAWLDEIIEITLNPQQTDVSGIKVDQLKLIETRFQKELREVFRQLKAGTFFLFSSKKLDTIITHYYDALVTLERQAMFNLAAYASDQPLAITGENLLIAIQELKSAITKRYGVSGKNSRNEVILSGSNVLSKIFCKLSVDQIGIILKAADDTRLIIASSLSLIFRSLVPFLSTENAKSISWNSMRKSTYHMEQHDKDIAIEALEKLITKIRNY
ncbi:hypothetical protein PQ469_24590 [Mucilaginibacter sp. KACC 22773]|uniref:hypothetical protein n=1 Tax=Mucilaginibacter sp. KACC 22773 TaxID=3025671 RepID=UPI002365FA14|nr:hypothetical protein [Mucilaginibacter sp. KACC 22773]WDF77066.1 hypothetical protein PQ469_24590 [Mucilaginibacter sp. KACC 22773]